MFLLILLSAFYTSSDSSINALGGRNRTGSHPGQPSTTTPLVMFSADTQSSVNVTGQLGASVELPCRVSRLPGETEVSWLRRRQGQLRLLAVGLELYSSDYRYSVRLQDSRDWTLGIRPLQESDQGDYQCQVPSYPPRVHSVYLHVVVPEMEITDERDVPIKDKFYNSGSTIQLKCRLTRVPRPSHFLLWRHNNDILNYDTSRGGISVRTDLTEDGAWSRLLVTHATVQDSGNYSCSLADVAGASVTVHVLNVILLFCEKGEIPAAMQHGGSCQRLRVSSTLLLVVLVLPHR